MRSIRLASSLRPALALAGGLVAVGAQAGTGTYLFNNSLAAAESGSPSLAAIDPLGQNAFGTATIYGATRSVYNTSGTGTFAQNAGVALNAASLITSTQYSLEAIVAYTATDGYRKLADVSGRTDDSGFYVHDSRLNVYPVTQGTLPVATATYNYLVLTVANGTVKGYVNGALDFTTTTTVMNGNAFSFFVDDNHQGYEYSTVSVGFLRLRDTVLTDAQVASIAVNPYATAPVPEPATMAALGLGALAALRRRRRA